MNCRKKKAQSTKLGNVFDEEKRADEDVETYDGDIPDDYDVEYTADHDGEIEESEEDSEDYDGEDEEIEEKPQPKTAEKKGKPIQVRKRKEKPQMTLFDLLGENTAEKNPYERRKEEMITTELRKKGGWQKYRIYECYIAKPMLDEFAKLIKNTYVTLFEP